MCVCVCVGVEDNATRVIYTYTHTHTQDDDDDSVSSHYGIKKRLSKQETRMCMLEKTLYDVLKSPCLPSASVSRGVSSEQEEGGGEE